jgi:hypothetical protein
MMSALGLSDANAASRKLQEKGLDAASAETTAQCAEWLGCWNDQPIDTSGGSNVMDVFCALLTSNSELWFKEGERDMLAMHHEFGVEWPDNSSSTFTSSMLCFGEDGEGGDSVSGVRVWVHACALECAYENRVEI